MKKKYGFVAALLLFVAICDAFFIGVYRKWEIRGEAEGLVAVASFYPIYIAAENIVGGCEGIRLQSLSEPQTGCLHDFVLTPEDMKLLSGADVFLTNGGGMESFLSDVAARYPSLTVVETADDLILADGNAHAWMSVENYRLQVSRICDALCALAPEYEEELLANAAAYEEKLLQLQKQQEEIKEAVAGEQILSFHEAFSYLAQDYALSIAYELNLDEERQVSAGEVADVLKAVKESGVRILFAEELYGSELAQAITKEADVEVYYLDSLVRGGYDSDSYIDGMQKNIDLIKEAFGV